MGWGVSVFTNKRLFFGLLQPDLLGKGMFREVSRFRTRRASTSGVFFQPLSCGPSYHLSLC